MGHPLTVCIPTYNRRDELSEALESIREAFGSSINVVVSDNASTDGTEEQCRAYQKDGIFNSFRYFRWETNQGPDRNYLKAVELAESEYCMLLGSDDAFLPEAGALLMDVLSYRPDIILFSRVLYSRDFKKKLGVETFWQRSIKERYELSDDASYDEYIKSCTSLAGFFSYISVIVFRRDNWVENPEVHQFIGSAYSHVAALLQGMREKKSCLLQIERRPLVKCRMGNDSFLQGGHLRRFSIDWDGYERLAATYFPARPQVLSQILNYQCSLRSLLALRFHLESEGNVAAIREVTSRLGSSDWGRRARWYWRMFALMPLGIFRLLYVLKKVVLRY